LSTCRRAIDRADIFRVHLAKRRRDPAEFDLQLPGRAGRGVLGAEDRRCGQRGILEAFEDGRRPVRTDDVARALASIRPLATDSKPARSRTFALAREALAIDANRGTPLDGREPRSLEL